MESEPAANNTHNGSSLFFNKLEAISFGDVHRDPPSEHE